MPLHERKRSGPEGPPRVAAKQTTGIVPHRGTSDDPRRIGELLATWLGIQLDTVDSLTAEAAAKVEAIPDRQVLLTLLGEIIVRLGAVELEVADLRGGRR